MKNKEKKINFLYKQYFISSFTLHSTLFLSETDITEQMSSENWPMDMSGSSVCSEALGYFVQCFVKSNFLPCDYHKFV